MRRQLEHQGSDERCLGRDSGGTRKSFEADGAGRRGGKYQASESLEIFFDLKGYYFSSYCKNRQKVMTKGKEEAT